MLVRRELSELSDADLISIFSGIEYEKIPVEFIDGVKLANMDGTISYFTGEEFKAYINTLPMNHTGMFELALNIDRFSKNVNAITRDILNKVRNDKSDTSS